jgi:hypothetical protein
MNTHAPTSAHWHQANLPTNAFLSSRSHAYLDPGSLLFSSSALLLRQLRFQAGGLLFVALAQLFHVLFPQPILFFHTGKFLWQQKKSISVMNAQVY